MKRLISFVFGLFATSHGLAADDRLARLMSDDFARQAEQHLASCDRGNALIAALRGLPEDPTEEDFSRFERTSLLMFRAVAARTIRIDGQGTHLVAFSPNGLRLAVVGFGGEQWDNTTTPDRNAPPALYDTQTGARVAQLLAPEIAFAPTAGNPRPPHFSPDGRLIAVFGLMDGRVHLFDGLTGAPVGVLESGLQALSMFSFLGSGLGFSHDGARFAAGVDDALLVWDVASGTLLHRYATGVVDGILHWPFGWTHDGAILVQRMESATLPDLRPGRTWLETWRNGGVEGVFALPDLPGDGHGMTVGDISRAGPQKIFQTATGRPLLLDWETGAFLEFQGVFGMVAFTRGGEAVVSISQAGLTDRSDGVSVFDLAGNRLTPEPHDYLALDRLVCDLSGNGIGGYFPDGTTPVYAAADVPTGKALYDWVWANVPEGVRAVVSADRVVRP